MARPPGNWDVQSELNTAGPLGARIKMGDWMANVIKTLNQVQAQSDAAWALASTSIVTASGTLTVGGTATAGNTYTVQFVNPGVPSLVTPGITLAGTVVTGSLANTAAQIAAQINASAVLSAAMITASVAAAVVTVRQPGVLGNGLVMTTGVVGAITVTATSLTSGVGAVTPRATLNAMPLLTTY